MGMPVFISQAIKIKYLLKDYYWPLTIQNYVCPPLLHLSQEQGHSISIDEFINCFADVATPKHILLHGKAGSGKSILMKYFSQLIAHPKFDAVINVPLARLLVLLEKPSLIDIFSWCQENNYIFYQRPPVNNPSLNTMKILWLIDEWDELSSSSIDIDTLQCELFKQSHMIIASRYYDKKYFKLFEQIHVLCPNDNTLDSLSKTYEFQVPNLDTFKYPPLSTIAEAELFFTLAKENKIDIHSPISSSLLGKAGISLMTESIFTELNGQVEQLMLFLRYLAFYAFDQNYKRFFDEHLVKWVCKKIFQDNASKQKNNHAITPAIMEVACGAGFIEVLTTYSPIVATKYCFRHILFQEYFASQFVIHDLLHVTNKPSSK
jgi:hypothetical protein